MNFGDGFWNLSLGARVRFHRLQGASATWVRSTRGPRIDRGGVEGDRHPPSAPPCRSSDLTFFLKFCCARGLKVAPNSPDPCIEAVFEPAEVVRIGIRPLGARTVVFETICFFIFEDRPPLSILGIETENRGFS